MTNDPRAEAIRIAIVEDNRRVREGLVVLINKTPGFRAVGAFSSMEEALDKIDSAPPDVVLLDIGLPGMSGVEGARRLSTRHPELPLLILTVHSDDDHVFEAICAGACGYLLKDTPPERLIGAIREASGGGSPISPEIARRVLVMFQHYAPVKAAPTTDLTPREVQLLRLLADGHSYKTAAVQLQVSQDTVRFHVRHIYEKLHVHSKSQAVLKAFRDGILR